MEGGFFRRFVLWEAVLYGALLLGGGFLGWRKKKSQASLVAGVVSSLAVFTTVFFGWGASEAKSAFFVLASTALTLMVVFFNRYLAGGRKFMPAGLMTLVSAGSFMLYLAALVFGV